MKSNDVHNPPPRERPLNKAELAAYLRCSVRQVERLMASGEIDFFRVGRSPRFTRAAIMEFECACSGALRPLVLNPRRTRRASSRFPFSSKPDPAFARLLASDVEGS
jgi:excisionase family DNA binding protein